MTALSSSAYPSAPQDRDRWILSRRGPRNAVAPDRPYAFLLEQEPAANGKLLDTATLFLTGRECPWRCLMCDLWQNTTVARTPVGAIPAQIDFALSSLGGGRQVKLYNSGSFFDRMAVPVEDYPVIAERIAGFERLIVESHPNLIGDLTWRFRDALRRGPNTGPRLEVAMGLETAHPDVLEKLNKRFTVADFSRAAEQLRRESIDLRVFVLVKPPFMDEAGGIEWALRSAEFAFDCGATVVSLIPTRPGNGALEELAWQGHFAPPHLASLEAAFDQCLQLGRGRVFADLWDLEKFSRCPSCFEPRRQRLAEMNLNQQRLSSVHCDQCSA